MTFKRIAAAAALLISLGWPAGLGSAPQAQAEPVIQGVYHYHQEGLSDATWTIFPSCVPVVGDLREPLELAVACRLHITGKGGVTGGDAVMTGGQWTYTTTVKEGLQCSDGSWEPITETVKFDDVALTGTRSVANNAVCGLAPAIHTVPFSLSFKDPLPIPVDLYPLDCEPGGLRWCT